MGSIDGFSENGSNLPIPSSHSGVSTNKLGSKLPHKVNKEDEQHTSQTGKKVLKIFGAVVAAPILAGLAVGALGLTIGIGVPGAIIGHGVKRLNELYKIKRYPESPVAICKKLKTLEEVQRRDALREVDVNNIKKDQFCSVLLNTIDDAALEKDISERLVGDPTGVKKTMIERHLDRFIQRNAIEPAAAERLKSCVLYGGNLDEKSLILGFSRWSEPQSYETSFKEVVEEMMSDLSFVGQTDAIREKDSQDFKNAILDLHKTIHAERNNPGKQNIEITKKFRTALNCRAYQAMKYDTESDAIKYLHKLAYAMYTSRGSAESQQEIAETLLNSPRENATPEDGIFLTEANNPNNPFGNEVVNRFHQANKEGRETLELADGGTIAHISYGLRHPEQVRGVVASWRGLKGKIGSIGHTYDPHLLSNNSSLQGTTHITVTKNNNVTSGEIKNIYGPSPTVGDKVAPEFLALCQGGENNLTWALKQKNKTPDSQLPTKIVFINLQKWDKSAGEGGRSVALMGLNNKFPNVCKVITLSKDSKLYREKSKSNIESFVWSGNPKIFGREMLNELEKELEQGVNKSRVKNPSCCFPASFDRNILKKAIEQANESFKGHGFQRGAAAYKLRGAYQEYVYQLIQRQSEIEAVKELNGLGIKEGDVVVKASCKEHADRGGMNGMALAYLRSNGKEEEEEVNQIVGAGLYRALVAKDRMVQGERITHPLAMMEYISPQTFQQNVASMNDDSVEIGQFEPAV